LKLLKSNRGFTLVELVVVIAVIALIMAGVALSIGMGRKAGSVSSAASKMRTIEAGLHEYKTYKGAIPAQAEMSTTWPEALEAYVSSELRAGGAEPHGYQCAAATKTATIRTPAFTNAAEAGDVKTKLVDQGLCESDSTVTAANEVDCVVATLKGTAGCI
jgi:prepilin-type N-terminal cleavage/methylation domain-containing protein